MIGITIKIRNGLFRFFNLFFVYTQNMSKTYDELLNNFSIINNIKSILLYTCLAVMDCTILICVFCYMALPVWITLFFVFILNIVGMTDGLIIGLISVILATVVHWFFRNIVNYAKRSEKYEVVESELFDFLTMLL